MAFDISSILSNSADVNFAASLLFVFAISYALLAKVKVIDIKGANALIALVIGFFAASFGPLTQFLQGILPIAAILLVVAFLIEFGRKLAGGGANRDAVPTAVALIVSLALLGVLWSRIVPNLPAGVDPTQLLWILGIVIVLLIFYRIYKHAPV